MDYRHAPICCVNCVPMEPSRALLTDSLSFCLSLRTTSLANIRALLTSPFFASCLTDVRALLVAISNCAMQQGQTWTRYQVREMPTCLISRSNCRDSERSFCCQARTFSSGVGPYKNLLIDCILLTARLD